MMPPRKPGVRHARVAPCVDVAACGERGFELRYCMSFAGVTCPLCRVRRQKTIDAKRVGGMRAARARYYRDLAGKAS